MKENHTGWNNGLSKDYDKKLGTWFADKPGAKQELREQFQQPVSDLTDAEIRKIQSLHPTENDPMPFARSLLSAQKGKS